MADKEMVMITIEVTAQEREQIEQRAQERGYESTSEYLLALVNEDAEEDVDNIDPEASFRRGWHEAMTGKTRPIEAVWKELDDE